jgi:hypothetical protein
MSSPAARSSSTTARASSPACSPRAAAMSSAAKAGAGDGELHAVAAHALADAQVEDRHIVDRLGVEHEDGMGELEVGDLGLQARVGDRLQRLAGDRGALGVQVRRAERLAHDPLQEEALLVRRAGAGQRGGAAVARAAEGLGGLLERAVPLDGAQLAAVADHRRRDAVVDVEGLVGEAPAVADPAVVDLLVVAHVDAHDAVVADGQGDVALAGAHRADRAGALDVPRARAEAVGLARQRADGAQLDDVAAERRHVRVAVEGGDVGLGAALLEHELVVLGDLLGVAHAAVAEDAALAVDRDQRRQLERLLEVALGLDEPRAAAAPAEGDVLQRALAALVADRAVERVVDEQELDHRLLRLVHARGLGVDDHAVLDRRRAAGLELRDALDLHEAHAAGADGLAELGLVAEHRDLDVAVLGGVDEHHVLGRLHLSTVDREGDHVDLGAGHYASAPCTITGSTSGVTVGAHAAWRRSSM